MSSGGATVTCRVCRNIPGQLRHDNHQHQNKRWKDGKIIEFNFYESMKVNNLMTADTMTHT